MDYMLDEWAFPVSKTQKQYTQIMFWTTSEKSKPGNKKFKNRINEINEKTVDICFWHLSKTNRYLIYNTSESTCAQKNKRTVAGTAKMQCIAKALFQSFENW